MKRPRLRGRWPWLGLLVVPAMAWAVVLALVPTEWARARLVDRLADSTGRVVRIGGLRLGVLGNLRILDLSLAERSTPADPWLRVAEARVDVHLGQVLLGRCKPGEIAVEGASVRAWRRRDGSLEIGDILRATPGSSAASKARPDPGASPMMALVIRGSSLRVVDEPSGTRFDLTGVEAEASCDGRTTTLRRMKGSVNGGTFELAARLERDPIAPRFEVEARVSGLAVDNGLPALAYLVPVVAGTSDGAGAGGKLDLSLNLDGRGATRAEVRRSLHGQGSVRIDPIDLDGSKFLAALDALGDAPRPGKIGAVSADLRIGEGRVSTENLTIQVSRFPFVLGGWTDFDGRFDYAPRIDRIADTLPAEARAWVAELRVNFDQLAGLRLRGTPEAVEVTLHGHPLTGDPTRPDDERARFREAARRIRDRFLR